MYGHSLVSDLIVFRSVVADLHATRSRSTDRHMLGPIFGGRPPTRNYQNIPAPSKTLGWGDVVTGLLEEPFLLIFTKKRSPCSNCPRTSLPAPPIILHCQIGDPYCLIYARRLHLLCLPSFLLILNSFRVKAKFIPSKRYPP